MSRVAEARAAGCPVLALGGGSRGSRSFAASPTGPGAAAAGDSLRGIAGVVSAGGATAAAPTSARIACNPLSVIRSAIQSPASSCRQRRPTYSGGAGTSVSKPCFSMLRNTALRAAAGKPLGAIASQASCCAPPPRICSWVSDMLIIGAPGAGPDQPGPTSQSPAEKPSGGGALASGAARVRPFAPCRVEVKRKCAGWADNAFAQISTISFEVRSTLRRCSSLPARRGVGVAHGGRRLGHPPERSVALERRPMLLTNRNINSR
jgi:hypothetical protein